MRSLSLGLLFFAACVLATTVGWADNRNQQIATQIAKNLDNSGKLSNYQIEVKFQDGTAWLTGRVQSEQQMSTALKIAFATPGVARVVNNLSVQNAAPPTPDAKWLGHPTEADEQTAIARLRMAGYVEPIPLKPNNAANNGTTNAANQSAAARPLRPLSAVDATVAPPRESPRPLPAAAQPQYRAQNTRRPVPVRYTRGSDSQMQPEPLPGGISGAPLPMHTVPVPANAAPIRYDQPHMPNYAWPSYAAYPNYAAVTYPKLYSPTAWPFIGPFYPYPQVPLGWRKVTLEWDDGWWMLDFQDKPSCLKSPMGRWY
jgi:hypothetical protein